MLRHIASYREVVKSLISADQAYSEVISTVRSVLCSALFVDVFAVSQMPWPKSATKNSVKKAASGAPVLLEEVLVEMGSTISALMLQCSRKESEIENMRQRIID